MLDAYAFRIVVLAIAAISALSVGGVVIVEASGHQASPILGAIATAGIGALCGLLVRPPSAKRSNSNE